MCLPFNAKEQEGERGCMYTYVSFAWVEPISIFNVECCGVECSCGVGAFFKIWNESETH